MAYEKVKCPAVFDSPSPYSQAVITTGTRLIHISGQVAMDSNGALVGRGDVEAQAVQALTNMKALVEAAGGTMKDVARIAFFILDRAELPKVMAVRRRFFAVPYPATTGLIVSGLAQADWLVEIEGTAYLP